MDTDVSANGNKEESWPQHSIVKKLKGSDQSPGVETVRGLPQLPTETSYPLGPVTPDSTREGGDHVDGCCSPVSSLRRTLCFNSQQHEDLIYSNEGSPRTPKGSVFDPFAPGPDELMLVPQCKKYFKDSRTKVIRQLKFESLNFDGNVDCTDNMGTVSEDDMLFELLYYSFLEVITSKQTEEGLHAKASSPLSDSDGFKTPTSAPHLSGVADTCPGAPSKPANPLRNMDKGLCRKLLF